MAINPLGDKTANPEAWSDRRRRQWSDRRIHSDPRRQRRHHDPWRSRLTSVHHGWRSGHMDTIQTTSNDEDLTILIQR